MFFPRLVVNVSSMGFMATGTAAGSGTGTGVSVSPTSAPNATNSSVPVLPSNSTITSLPVAFSTSIPSNLSSSSFTLSTSSIPTATPIPSMSSSLLNWTRPYPYYEDEPLDVLGTLGIVVGFYCGESVKTHEKTSDVIIRNAHVILSNPTEFAEANSVINGVGEGLNGPYPFYDQFAEIMGTTVDNVFWMTWYSEGNATWGALMLWAAALLENSTLILSTNPEEVNKRDVKDGTAQVQYTTQHYEVPSFRTTKATLSLVIIFMIISIVTTGARMYSRWRFGGTISIWVDVVFLVGVVIGLAISGIFGNSVVMLADQGAGSVWGITYATLRKSNLHGTLINVLYHACVGSIKASILLFYFSMTPILYQRIIIISVLFICVSANIAGFFFQIFENHPVDYWNYLVTRTINPIASKFIFGVGIVNIFTDCVIWCMPIPWILKLGKNWKAQIISSGIIFSSAISCVFSALRVVNVWHGNMQSRDGSLTEWAVILYALIEIHLAIWCYNIPALRILFTKGRTQGRLGSNNNNNTATTYNSSSKNTAKERELKEKGSSVSMNMLMRRHVHEMRNGSGEIEGWEPTILGQEI